ncbi:RNA-directed DNA polymerase, eukaryota [Tanacetum coccineum]
MKFPRLFALELDKEIVVANKMGASSVSASFRRDVRDGAERQQWDDLSSIMNSVVLSSSKDINVFSWRARRDRLPTRVNLSRRGVLLDSHLCPLCNAAMRMIQHICFDVTWLGLFFEKFVVGWDMEWHEILSFSDWDAGSYLSTSSRLKSNLEECFYVAYVWRFGCFEISWSLTLRLLIVRRFLMTLFLGPFYGVLNWRDGFDFASGEEAWYGGEPSGEATSEWRAPYPMLLVDI